MNLLRIRSARRIRASTPDATSPSRGFTLFEIMCALGIFMFGIVGVMSLLAMALRMHKEALDRETAAMAADEVLGELEEIAPTLERDPDSGDLKPLTDRPVPGRDGYTYTVTFREARETEDPDPLIEARLQIAWKSRGKRRAVEFVSYLNPTRSFREEVERVKPKSAFR